MEMVRRLMGMSQEDERTRHERARLAAELLALAEAYATRTDQDDPCPACGSGLILQFGTRRTR